MFLSKYNKPMAYVLSVVFCLFNLSGCLNGVIKVTDLLPKKKSITAFNRGNKGEKGDAKSANHNHHSNNSNKPSDKEQQEDITFIVDWLKDCQDFIRSYKAALIGHVEKWFGPWEENGRRDSWKFSCSDNNRIYRGNGSLYYLTDFRDKNNFSNMSILTGVVESKMPRCNFQEFQGENSEYLGGVLPGDVFNMDRLQTHAETFLNDLSSAKISHTDVKGLDLNTISVLVKTYLQEYFKKCKGNNEKMLENFNQKVSPIKVFNNKSLQDISSEIDEIGSDVNRRLNTFLSYIKLLDGLHNDIVVFVSLVDEKLPMNVKQFNSGFRSKFNDLMQKIIAFNNLKNERQPIRNFSVSHCHNLDKYVDNMSKDIFDKIKKFGMEQYKTYLAYRILIGFHLSLIDPFNKFMSSFQGYSDIKRVKLEEYLFALYRIIGFEKWLNELKINNVALTLSEELKSNCKWIDNMQTHENNTEKLIKYIKTKKCEFKKIGTSKS